MAMELLRVGRVHAVMPLVPPTFWAAPRSVSGCCTAHSNKLEDKRFVRILFMLGMPLGMLAGACGSSLNIGHCCLPLYEIVVCKSRTVHSQLP